MNRPHGRRAHIAAGAADPAHLGFYVPFPARTSGSKDYDALSLDAPRHGQMFRAHVPNVSELPSSRLRGLSASAALACRPHAQRRTFSNRQVSQASLGFGSSLQRVGMGDEHRFVMLLPVARCPDRDDRHDRRLQPARRHDQADRRLVGTIRHRCDAFRSSRLARVKAGNEQTHLLLSGWS